MTKISNLTISMIPMNIMRCGALLKNWFDLECFSCVDLFWFSYGLRMHSYSMDCHWIRPIWVATNMWISYSCVSLKYPDIPRKYSVVNRAVFEQIEINPLFCYYFWVQVMDYNEKNWKAMVFGWIIIVMCLYMCCRRFCSAW